MNPGLSAVFSTAAYRLGHTLLSPLIQRLDENGASIPAGPLPLRDAFFTAAPPQLEQFGLEPWLRGVASQAMQELDAKVIDDVRNFLFGAPAAGGLDLVSLNLQRGATSGCRTSTPCARISASRGRRPFRGLSDIIRRTTSVRRIQENVFRLGR